MRRWIVFRPLDTGCMLPRPNPRRHRQPAPYAVTLPGITPPPNPVHGPWRRLRGQGQEADLSIGLPQVITIGFAAAGSGVGESGGPALVAVGLATSDGQLATLLSSVSYATGDGSATAGSDYTATAGTLSFPAGTASGSAQNLSLPILNDFVVEGLEGFTVSLSSPSGATLGLAAHSVDIVDDDGAGFIVAPNTGLTPTEAGGTADFSVALSSQPLAEVTVAIASGDTTEGTVAPASLTFSAGNWNPPQVVTLSNPTGITIADGRGFCLVKDDDDTDLIFMDGFDWSPLAPPKGRRKARQAPLSGFPPG